MTQSGQHEASTNTDNLSRSESYRETSDEADQPRRFDGWPRSGSYRDEQIPWWFVVDPFLILTTVAVTAFGVLLVHSATRGPATELQPADFSLMRRQVAYIVVGLASATGAALLDVRRLRYWVPAGYALTVCLLIGVVQFGADIRGAQSWFRLGGFTFQPSEPGKLALILVLAVVLTTETVSFRRMLAGLTLAGILTGLILMQPDLGTILIYIVITAVMISLSAVRFRNLVLLFLVAVTAIVTIFQSDLLKEFQKNRLTVFVLDDEAVQDLGEDAIRVAYNAEQSQIAIGNGGMTGQGLFRGTQTGSNLVPEQQTDFIFSVAGEELGFRGATILLALFAIILYRVWRVAVRATDRFDRMLAIGVMGMFVFQVFQSAGMTMGIMPVTGIPMPLVSYGGSSMVTSLTALGLVLGVHRRRFDYSIR